MWLLVQVMQLAVEIAAYGEVFAAVSLSNLSAAAEVCCLRALAKLGMQHSV